MGTLKEILNQNGDEDELANVPDYIIKAPGEVRKRISALKKLHLQMVDKQSEYFKRIHELECEYREHYDKINDKRTQIIKGEYEPTENECDEKIFHWMSDEGVKKFQESELINGNGPVKGIPDFWKNTINNVPGFEVITPADQEALKYLNDIKITMHKEPAGFTLHFMFEPNPYFTNTELTKHYKLSVTPSSFEPKLLYDGPSIISSQGCQIDWKGDMNLTKKVVKKKQRKGSETRDTVKTVDNDSFFHFFSPELREVTENTDETDVAVFNEDFEIGQSLRDMVIDSAVLYYTGECVDDEDYDGFEDEDLDFDEDEEES